MKLTVQGADSMGGLFDEIGPCTITEEIETELNPNSWNELSNLVFFSQPVGIGFSYDTTVELPELPTGIGNETAPARVSMADAQLVNSTELAAEDMWQAMSLLYEALPEMAPDVKSKTLHMATQSYGGHWGPAMFNKFRKETEDMVEKPFEIGSLMIVNGVTDALIQYPSFPLFAAKNTHGVHSNPLLTL
jgi:carboxypeptidase C (cathepsin A)